MQAGSLRSPDGTSRMLALPKFSVSLVAGIGDPGRRHRCRLQLRGDEQGKETAPENTGAVISLILVNYRGDGVGEVSPFFPLPLPWRD
ncbi:MAG: hypothetical protein DMF14_09790 [Verrucomicrobia bacterium]|nr:MAG: hypothetical protein DMF14_09790 [Verrucomicrobiota bacterium]